ncbi:ceramide-1-phosphate transfer protein [Salix suchowensis]|nr:ceramide-1-phosphate transfer protein [Salix suchowensis]
MGDLETEKPLRKIAEAFKELEATINSQAQEVEVASFSHACSLVSPLFGCLGIAFKFAEMDYVAKFVREGYKREFCEKRGSHTRNLLRVRRGLDMVKILFEQILVTKEGSLKGPASKAYELALAPHHGWTIRKAVAAGMYALPIREQLFNTLNEDESSARLQMQSYVAASATVIMYVDKLFLTRGLGIDW